ncbi:MAG: DUF4861 domain-containing protein [Prevotellaceae bacterium]|nr:DUF4861 domain-containing protein [Prevotellaceae bacterium]
MIFKLFSKPFFKPFFKSFFKFCLAAAVVLGASCCSTRSPEIIVRNTSDFDRIGETVEINLRELDPDFVSGARILADDKGAEIPYQVVDGGRTLIFQVSLRARSSAAYRFGRGAPAPVPAKTRARHVPERKDDFAWENDLAAYRMYGPALAKENPSNGVDLWLKCTDSLIVDKFYADELERGLSYHVNRGLGLDCYGVGHTLGAGGIAPYTSRLWIGDHYTGYEIRENGPLRSVFVLAYDSVEIDGRRYRQTVETTCDAGSPLNKAIVRYEGLKGSFRLAAGIVLHNGKGVRFSDAGNGFAAYAEDAVSDAGVPQGRSYAAVCAPADGARIVEEDNHLLLLAPYETNEYFTYWFGGGWSRWKFASDEDWFKAVELFARARKMPLETELRQKLK